MNERILVKRKCGKAGAKEIIIVINYWKLSYEVGLRLSRITQVTIKVSEIE